MSGLLDKANKTAGESDAPKEATIDATMDTEEPLQLDSKITVGLQVAGVLALLVKSLEIWLQESFDQINFQLSIGRFCEKSLRL